MTLLSAVVPCDNEQENVPLSFGEFKKSVDILHNEEGDPSSPASSEVG